MLLVSWLFKSLFYNLQKLIRLCLIFAGVLLLVTAIAKFISSFGGGQVLRLPDPIFDIPMRQVFQLIATLELSIAFICFFGKQLVLQAGILAALSSNFVVYRLGLLWLGYHKPCSCLGTLTDALHISEEAADIAMKIILGYLLVVSYAMLFWLWRKKREVASSLGYSN